MKYTDIKDQSVTIISEGDSNEWSVGISRPTIERILKSDIKFKADMLSLWMFYAYTARWQKTNQPRATVMFVMQALNWGSDKVRKARNGLKKLNLISDVQVRGDDGKMESRYVRIHYLTKGVVESE